MGSTATQDASGLAVNVPISILGLSPRVHNALNRGGVSTWAELQGGVRELFSAPGSGIGPRALDEIEARLNDLKRLLDDDQRTDEEKALELAKRMPKGGDAS